MAQRKFKLNPLMLLPGTVFWGLVIAGATTGNDALLGVAVCLAASMITIAVAVKIKRSSREKAERKRIWSDGVDAKARIVTIGTRGGGINDHPMIDFELDVMMPGRDAFRVETRALISQLAIPRIQPGCEIQVRLDPDQPTQLLVDAALTPYGY